MAEITWEDTPLISKITLPSGTSYYLKDAEARRKIAALGAPTHFLGQTTTALTDGSTANPITIGGQSVTAEGGDIVVYSNGEGALQGLTKEFIFDGSEWLELGDLSHLGTLAYKNDVTLQKGTGKNVLGTGTSFRASDSEVSFNSSTTTDVIGANATFQATAPTITVTPATTSLGATASGTAVTPATTADAITGFGAHTTDTFVKSVSAETNKKLVTTTVVEAGTAVDVLQEVTPTKQKLVTTSVIPAVTANNRAIQNVTAVTDHLVTTSIPNVTGNTSVSIPNVTDNTSVSIQSVTSVGTADTWSFAMGSNETLIISGANGTVPTVENKVATNVTLGTALQATKVTLGTAITAATGAVSSTGTGDVVATGLNTPTWMAVAQEGTAVTVANGTVSESGTGSDVMIGVETSTESVATVGSTTTVATGGTDAAGGGDAIVTGVTIGQSAAAITALGTPTKATVLQSVTVTQPTITLEGGQTGGYTVVTGITSATSTAPEVAFDNADQKTVIDNIGTGTAAGQTIIVGSEDNVTVADYSDLDVTVS